MPSADAIERRLKKRKEKSFDDMTVAEREAYIRKTDADKLRQPQNRLRPDKTLLKTPFDDMNAKERDRYVKITDIIKQEKKKRKK